MKTVFVRIFKYIFVPLSLLVLALLLAGVTTREIKISKVRTARAMSGDKSIEAVVDVSIGGTTQWLQIRTQDFTNPVLLYLHGGPGSPMMPMNHSFQNGWEKHFTVVQWDQREAGKSYTGKSSPHSLTIERYIADTLEVTEYLRKRFKQKKIVLLGHSWGSLLGVHAIARKPEYYSAYVGVGQVVHMMKGEALSYQYTLAQAKKRNHSAALKDLQAIAPYPDSMTTEKVLVERRWLTEFGGAIYGETSPSIILGILLTSPDYDLGDLWGFVAGSLLSLDTLWPQLTQADIERDLGFKYQVPLFLFSGRHDYQVPSSLSSTWFKKLEAPHKEEVWFEKSCHVPMYSEPARFTSELVKRVLPYAKGDMN